MPKRILLIKEDRQVRSFYEESLRALGYEVIGAETAIAAVEKLIHINFGHEPAVDLIVTGIRMSDTPDIPGEKLITVIANNAGNTPIVIASGGDLIGAVYSTYRNVDETQSNFLGEMERTVQEMLA